MAVPAFRKFFSIVKATGFIAPAKSITASATATRSKNAGRTNILNAAAGLTITLPATSADAVGDKYRFVVGTLGTSNAYIIQVANATDVLAGGIFINDIGDTSAAAVDFYPTAASSDTVTLTASAGAGKIGDWVEFEVVAAGKYAVTGVLQGEADPTSPFSAAVS